MKLRLVLLLTLILIVTAVFAAAQASVMDTADAVVYTETSLIGDPREADGVTLDLALGCNDHLFWDTTLTLGDTVVAETAFRHRYTEPQAERTVRSRFELYFGLNNFGGSSSGDMLDNPDHFMGMYEMIADVASRTPAGQTYAETVRPADYYDYYPVTANIMLGGNFYYDSTGERYSRDDFYEAQYEALEALFDEHFRVPIPQNDRRKITIEKRANGTVASINVSSWDDGKRGEDLYLGSFAIITEDAIYFTFEPIVSGETTRAYEADGAYTAGLYRLPYKRVPMESRYAVAGDYAIELQFDAFELVKPFSGGAYTEAFERSADGKTLLLTTRHPGEAYTDTLRLTVLNAETHAVLEETTLFTCQQNENVHLDQVQDDFLLYRVQWMRFVVVDRATGIWQTALTIEDPTVTDIWSAGDVISSYYDLAADWDGERLLLAAYAYETGGNGMEKPNSSYCAVYLSIYGKKGNLYTGKLLSSLDTGTFLRYNDSCRPVDNSAPIARLP